MIIYRDTRENKFDIHYSLTTKTKEKRVHSVQELKNGEKMIIKMAKRILRRIFNFNF